MLRLIFTFFVIVSMILCNVSCYSRHEPKPIEPTEAIVHKTIEIQTNDGKKYNLIIFKITNKKIIGQDDQGNHREELLENIKNVIEIRKLTTRQQIPIFLFFAGATAVLVFYLSLKGLEGLR